MKTLLFAFTISFFALTISAQNKITGFGKLQLGMSVYDIPELSKAKKVTTSVQYFTSVYNNTSKNVYEVICDTTEKYPQGIYDTRVREFQIGKYNVTESIEVTNITLKFFNDKLYSIDIKDSKLNELLTAKYGDGELTSKEEDHTFQNGYGATFVKTDRTFTTTWKTDEPNVTCKSVLMSWYNDHGEHNVIAYTILEDDSHKDEINDASKIIEDRIAKRIADKKKQDLDGF